MPSVKVPCSMRLVIAAVAVLALAGGHGSWSPAEAATTLTVTTTEDILNAGDVVCSLREAVLFANSGGVGQEADCGTDALGPYTILLENGEIYTLGIAGDDDAAFTGDLDIINGVVVIIQVDGGGTATVDQLTDDRVFDVLDGSLTLNGITVTGGQASIGGGIYNFGVLVLTDSVVTENEAFDLGGGIYNEGHTVTLTRTMVTDNVARFDGGGIYNDTPADDEIAVLNIDSGTISGNTAGSDTEFGEGGGIFTEGVARLINSTVSENTAFGHGGGVYVEDFLDFEDQQISVLTVTDSTISGNTAAGTEFELGFGGGIFNDEAEVTVTGSTVSGNTAHGDGGGLYNNLGIMTLITSTVNGNQAIEGEDGGGLVNDNGTMSVINSTVSGNTAGDEGGGIFTFEAETRLVNVTVANNTAATGGGLAEDVDDPETYTFVNTLIANNTPDDCAGPAGSFVSQGNNLDTDGTCVDGTFAGDLPNNQNANLGPLALNAPGTTQTHALLAGSDAIDAGNNAVCADEQVSGVDQRGVTRPQDGDVDGDPVCDIGAYELEAAAVAPALAVTKVCVGEGFDATFELSVDGRTEAVACGGSVPFAGLAAGDYTLTETIGGADAGGFLTVIVCGGAAPVAAASAPVTIPDDGSPVSCVVVNVFEGGLDIDDILALLLFLPLDLEIDIGNENTNDIGLENDNTNNNANDNANENGNTNLNGNENDNENTNEQDQTNEQGQDNSNEQTNNIDSSPEVNIDFGD